MAPWLALVLAGSASPGLSQQAEDRPTLSVRGSAEVRAAPDTAQVRLGVVAEDASALEAQTEANQVAGRILAELERAGIPPAQVQTSQLQLQPAYSRPARGSSEPAKIVGYRASHVVSVRLRQLERVGPAIDAGLNAGANRLEGLSFELQNDLPARSRALAEAVAEARAKAQAMAEALGLELDGVLEVDEGGVIVRPLPMERMAMAEAASAATPVAPGEIVVRADVSIRYALAPR